MIESANVPLTGVLTLDEVADYLRLPKEVVEQEAKQGHIPGQRIKKQWRFLKASLDEWLGLPDQKSILLQQAGAFADDESLPEIIKAIYTNRSNSETEEEE